MNVVEKNKWKKFIKVSIIALIALFILFFSLKGINFEAVKKVLSYGVTISAIYFFWVFCVRDSQG